MPYLSQERDGSRVPDIEQAAGRRPKQARDTRLACKVLDGKPPKSRDRLWSHRPLARGRGRAGASVGPSGRGGGRRSGGGRTPVRNETLNDLRRQIMSVTHLVQHCTPHSRSLGGGTNEHDILS